MFFIPMTDLWLENEGITILRNIETLLIQQQILTFRNTWILTQSKSYFGVGILRTYLANSNAPLPPHATVRDLLVLVLDYSELQL
jgi:hypothetical protein